MNIAKILELSQRPPLYERSSKSIWEDPHIGEQMLAAHLHPEWDSASRKHSFIEASVRWLHETVLPPACDLLDLGCGPGLYSQPLAALGYQVTGLDLVPTSLAYAVQQAQKAGLDIQYRQQNYLQLEFEAAFDAALLIYCDYGALTDEERQQVAANVFRALRPGGLWVLDVWTTKFRSPDDLPKTWGGGSYGFWSGQPHVFLREAFHYPERQVFLDQTIVVPEEGEIQLYRVWERFFTEETLLPFFTEAGFRVKGMFGDVAGAALTADSQSLAVILEKP